MRAQWRGEAKSLGVAGLLLILFTATFGCSNPAKRETLALSDAVDRFRAADDAQKPGAAALIRGVVCSDPEVSAAKATCASAADDTAKALELKSEVEARLADLESKKLAPDDPAARALPLKLDESEKLLKQGRATMHDCESKIAALRLKHGT